MQVYTFQKCEEIKLSFVIFLDDSAYFMNVVEVSTFHTEMFSFNIQTDITETHWARLPVRGQN